MQNEPTNARFPGMLAAGGCLYTSAPGNVKTDPLSPPPPLLSSRGKIGLVALFFTLTLFFAACSDPTSPNTNVAVTGVSLNNTSGTIAVDSTVSLTATITPTEATNQTVSWESSDATVATVSGSGLQATVTGVAAGPATITVTTEDGSHTATYAVTVKELQSISVSIPPTKTMYIVGEEFDPEGLELITTFTDSTIDTVTWSPGLAESFTFGNFSPDNWNTTAATDLSLSFDVTYGGQTTRYTFDIQVDDLPPPNVAVAGVTLDNDTSNITVGDNVSLTATIEPVDATNQTVSWVSSDPDVATVSGSGKTVTVAGVAAGTAIITVTTADGSHTATCVVTVTSPAVRGPGFYIGADTTSVDLSSGTGTILDKAFAYIAANTNPEYTLVLGEDIPAQTDTITYNKANTIVTITTADSTERTIQKDGNGRLFTVGGTASNAKLVVDGSVTLKGIAANSAALVLVEYCGQLALKGNAKITGNTSSDLSGGVQLYGNSNDNKVTLTLEGNAEISDNHLKISGIALGGGVIAQQYANITLSGNAKIANNSAESTTNYTLGGGMYLGNTVTLTMSGGEISGNLAKSATSYAVGGGVSMGNTSTTFIISGGEIKLNKLEFATFGLGSGVSNGGVFILSGSAKITPKTDAAGYTTTADDRNSIYMNGVSRRIRIQGTLSEVTVGLIDLPSAWTASDAVLVDESGGALTNAPVSKFSLGYKILTASPYTLTDISAKTLGTDGKIGDL
ncbi:hypothetical protein AGMMS50293_17270 [Spirochaetia bacterium]|nr:hypothetical protein AGMMS50293_17270 [Spirochaetia bacterium]